MIGESLIGKTDKINEVESLGEEKELPKSSYEKMMENNQWGNQDITKKEELLSTNKPPNAQENAAIDPTDKSISPRIKMIPVIILDSGIPDL